MHRGHFDRVGFAYDAGTGNKELSMVFAATYVLGCIFAVLAVRQSGIFTAVIQPPLILFGAVPTAYFLFHGGQLGGIKDLAINCGYPLIERFPLMFFTSAAVLLVGMGRWYYGMSRRGTARSAAKDTKEKAGGRVSSITSKVSSLLTGEPTDAEDDAADTKEPPRRKHTIDRPARAAKSAAGTHPQPQDDQARHTVAIAAHAAAGDRDHRTGHRASPPTPQPAADRSAATRRTATPPRALVVGTRTPQGRAARRAAHLLLRPRRAAAPVRRLSAARIPPQQGKWDTSPDLAVRYRGGDDESDNRTENRSRPRSTRNSREADSWEYDI